MDVPNQNQIPVIKASGSYHDIGIVIGRTMKDHIAAILAKARKDLPPNILWKDILHQSKLYLTHSQAVYPQYIQELAGIADGADLPFEDLFALMCEELWDSHIWKFGTHRPLKGCTDLVARGRATMDGSTLLAHTNDEQPGHENHLVILKIQAEDEPEFLGVSYGGAEISSGYNAAGIGITGNQVDSNDCRPGVPRLLMVRAILAARRLGEALAVCTLPGRASNYNNIISDTSGEVFSMEGSASECEAIYIEEDILAHANHYVSPPMRKFIADRHEIANSLVRHNRAMRLLRENYGQISPLKMMEFLTDHTNYPASICMHGIKSITAYSIIIQLNELRCWIGKGRPCETTYTEYKLAPWISAQ
jgi:isopenicillin-N N-acyltransferase like protein